MVSDNNSVISTRKDRQGTIAGLVYRWKKLRQRSPRFARFSSPLFIVVIWPLLLFTLYQVTIASPRYESRVQLTIRTPEGAAAIDPAAALLLGGVSSAGSATNDALLAKAYIHSDDMLRYVEDSLALKAHYTSSQVDWFSRLEKDAFREDFLEYYQSHVQVEVDEVAGIITINAQGFTPEFAQEVANTIVERAEWYINHIAQQLAENQVAFNEAEKTENLARLQAAQQRLIEFQERYDLLDPEAEGVAMQAITNRLEGEVSAKRVELNALKATMTDSAPAVIMAQAELDSLEQQLELARNRLASDSSDNADKAAPARLSVNEIMARYSDYKLEVEIALQTYAASQAALEKARVDAYRKMKYLVVLESPTMPEDNAYPEVLYNILLLFVVLGGVFVIARIVLATVEELR